MRGRKPAPSHLKVIRNTARKDRTPRPEPTPVGDLLQPPDYLNLTARQRQIWARLVSRAAKGLLKCCSTTLERGSALHTHCALRPELLVEEAAKRKAQWNE